MDLNTSGGTIKPVAWDDKHRLFDDKNGIHTWQVLQLFFTSQTFPIHFFRQDRGFRVWEIRDVLSLGLEYLASSHIDIGARLQHV